MATQQKTVKVQLVRSPIGTKAIHRATVRGLGLRKLNSVSELQDTPAVRGMINKIDYLVKVLWTWNSTTSSPHRAPSTPSAASAVASAPAWARPRVAATRARSRAPAATTRSASKAARCRCSGACPSAASSRAPAKYNAEVTLAALERLGAADVDLLTLKQAGLVGELIKVVKVIKSGELKKAVKLNGIGATAGAKAAIEAAGGSVA